jgi:hypothetical protein
MGRIRACERLAGLNRRTVLGILETAGQKCARLLESKLVNLPLQKVQIDEVYAFVHCLQQNTEPENPIHGDQYTFLAVVCQPTPECRIVTDTLRANSPPCLNR